MLTPVQCLKEELTSVPNAQRRFQYCNDLMGIDLDKVVAAKTFVGLVMKELKNQVDATDEIVETTKTLVDVFYEGGISITTVLDPELKSLLFKPSTPQTEKLKDK